MAVWQYGSMVQSRRAVQVRAALSLPAPLSSQQLCRASRITPPTLLLHAHTSDTCQAALTCVCLVTLCHCQH